MHDTTYRPARHGGGAYRTRHARPDVRTGLRPGDRVRFLLPDGRPAYGTFHAYGYPATPGVPTREAHPAGTLPTTAVVRPDDGTARRTLHLSGAAGEADRVTFHGRPPAAYR